MKKGLVNLAQGTPEQLNKLKTFLLNVQTKTDTRLKTHADAVIFAIDQAERVSELEKSIADLLETIKIMADTMDERKWKIQELEKKIKELEDQIENLNAEIEGMAAFERERAKEVSEGMYND